MYYYNNTNGCARWTVQSGVGEKKKNFYVTASWHARHKFFEVANLKYSSQVGMHHWLIVLALRMHTYSMYT